MKLVSIITATYNSENYIRDTYNSIVMQDYEAWEWVVTDDCSTDSTMDILKSFSKNDSRVKIYSNKVNSGAGVSRNVSMRHAVGQYFAFIDSDDLWEADKLSKQIEFMERGVVISFTAFQLIDRNGHILNKCIDVDKKRIISYDDLLMKNVTFGCSTVIVLRDAVVDLSMPINRIGQDFCFWLLILKRGHKAFLLPSVLTKYRITPGSISRNKFIKAKEQWRIYRYHENLNFLNCIKYFFWYVVNAIFR